MHLATVFVKRWSRTAVVWQEIRGQTTRGVSPRVRRPSWSLFQRASVGSARLWVMPGTGRESEGGGTVMLVRAMLVAACEHDWLFKKLQIGVRSNRFVPAFPGCLGLFLLDGTRFVGHPDPGEFPAYQS